MNMRAPGAYAAGLTSPVDKRIGDAFPIIDAVYKELDKLIYLANNADNLSPKQILLRANKALQAIEWQREGDVDWLILVTFKEMTEVDFLSFEADLQAAVSEAQQWANHAHAVTADVDKIISETHEARDDVLAFVSASGVSKYFPSKQRAIENITTIPLNAVVEVSRDESLGNARTRYTNNLGTLEFQVNLDQLRIDVTTPDGSDAAGGFSDYATLRSYTGTATEVLVGVMGELVAGIYGRFYFDSEDSTTTDDGGTVIVTLSGKRYKRRIEGSHVNARWFEAKGDKITDDTSALNNAGLAAKRLGLKVLVPDGHFRVNGIVNFYTGLDCVGSFHLDRLNGSCGVSILSSKTPITLDATALNGFAYGSLQVTGFGANYAGATLLLRSTEVAIKRYNPDGAGGYTAPYTKRDTVLISDKNGKLATPLKNTYQNKATITATLVEYEEPIQINGIRFTSDATSVGAIYGGGGIFHVLRSNVVLNEPTFKNKDSAISPAAFGVLGNCANITINRADISGLQYAGLGYGFLLSDCSLVTLNDSKILDCRHSISGAYASNVTVNGGAYSEIDSHWGHDFTIQGGAIIHGGVLYAGSDITVRDCILHVVYSALSIRSDAPECKGKVVIKNNKIVSNSNLYLDVFYYASGTAGTYAGFDFEREIHTPDLLEIKGNTIDIPSAAYIRYIKFYNGLNFAHKPIKKMVIAGNESVNANRKTVTLWKDNSHSITPAQNPILIIRDEEMNGGSGSSPAFDNTNLYVVEKGVENNSWGYEITLDNCGVIYLTVDSTAISSMHVARSTVRHFFHVAQKTLKGGDVTFDKVAFNNAFLSGGSYFNFLNSLFSGAITYSNVSGFTDIDSRIKRSFGNVKEIGTTNAPTHLDGYSNPSFFS